MEAASKYLSEREKTVLNLLHSSGKFTRKDFHDLRVELKKLSAFVEMICFNYPRLDKKKFFKPWRIVFKKAGKVRELQVQVSLIKKYSGKIKPHDYIAHLNKNIFIAKREFATTVDAPLVVKLKRKFRDLHILSDGVPAEKFSFYLQFKEEQIKKWFSQNELKSEEAHELRKQLKIYTYNKEIFDPGYLKKSAFDNFLELVGKWHDLIVVSEQLRIAFENNEIIANDWEALITIRLELDRSSRELFADISEEYQRVNISGLL